MGNLGIWRRLQLSGSLRVRNHNRSCLSIWVCRFASRAMGGGLGASRAFHRHGCINSLRCRRDNRDPECDGRRTNSVVCSAGITYTSAFEKRTDWRRTGLGRTRLTMDQFAKCLPTA